jgi:hypothetical protein
MIYTDKWAFVNIPKTAGKNFIKRVQQKPGVVNAHNHLRKHANHNCLQWWLDRGSITRKQFIFTFIRNPYARLVSLYNHMLTSGNNPDLPDFKTYVMTDVMDRKTPPGLAFDYGWPMYKFIENDQNIKVRCYKIEFELPLVEKYIDFIFTDTKINGRPHPPWETYYDSETKEKVNLKYKQDFIQFDYDEHIPM